MRPRAGKNGIYQGGEVEALIRPAQPKDAPEVTVLMYMAGKSHLQTSVYDLMFPGDLEETLEKLRGLYTANVRSWFHYSHFLVSEVDGKAVATLCGYNELESGGHKVRDALMELGMDRAEWSSLKQRMQPFYRVNPKHPEDAWVLEAVAVFPPYRGNGLIQGLLREILEIGKRRGYRHAELRMFIGNEPARRAYEKAGFIAAEERVDPEFEKIFASPGMVRMVKELY
jgi:GNAT superfamily N-acetyltransferase